MDVVVHVREHRVAGLDGGGVPTDVVAGLAVVGDDDDTVRSHLGVELERCHAHFQRMGERLRAAFGVQAEAAPMCLEVEVVACGVQ